MINPNDVNSRIAFRKKIKGHVMTFKKNPGRIYLLSYPKTGRTWVRVIIGKYISELYRVPEESILEYTRDTIQFDLNEFVYTHGGLGEDPILIPDIFRDEDTTIILMKRNILDTLVSAYFHVKYRDTLYTRDNTNINYEFYKGSISDCIRDPRFGISKILEFYQLVYSNYKLHNNIYEFSYEDMLIDPEPIMRKIISILIPKPIDINNLKRSIEYSSFDNMQKLERENKIGLSTKEISDSNDTRSFKVRKSILNEYKEYMSDDDISYIMDKINQLPVNIKSNLIY